MVVSCVCVVKIADSIALMGRISPKLFETNRNRFKTLSSNCTYGNLLTAAALQFFNIARSLECVEVTHLILTIQFMPTYRIE